MQKFAKMPAKILKPAKLKQKCLARKPLNLLERSIQGDVSTNCFSSRSTFSGSEIWLRWCLLLAMLVLVPDFIAGLKDVSVTIPQAVKRGSNALLICNYDMENDTLYSVKWYKGRREFYRYTPKENPAMKVFPVAAGLNIERNLSNQSHVVLLAVPLNISGKFTCEISVEAPTFQTAMVSGELEVVELPEEQAIVTGIQPRYRIGDLVDGNCSIKYSKPAANLTWTINGIVVPLHHIKTYQIERYEESNLESVVSALHFMVTTQHFIKGQMRLKCTASIFDIFKEEIESVIEEDRPRIMASGRSYDMHNNYPYEQHASGDGFEDHNESFLTYSAADITSSATAIHRTTAHIYAKALKMHWKHIWTGLMAAVATIQASSSQQLAVEKKLKQRYSDVKWLSEVRNDEEGRAALEIFAARESVAYIFTAIFTSVFVCTLTRHFISCQRKRKNSVAAKGQQAMLPRRKSLIATVPSATLLLSKVTAVAAAAAATQKINGEQVIAASKKPTASSLTVKRTSKERKSFHNCVGRNLKLLCVRLVVGLAQTPLMMFRQLATAMANPLQKLPLMKKRQAHKQQQELQLQLQQGGEAILRNGAHFQSNSHQQLSLTVAGWSPSPSLPTTLNALTFDASGASVSTRSAVGDCSNSSSSSGGGGSNNPAIANFTKDPSKDQILLMMIAQHFDCQHVYEFFIVTRDVRSPQQQQQQQQQKQRQQKLQPTLVKAKALTVNWQSNCAALHPYCEC